MQPTSLSKEQISAFVDGQLGAIESAQAFGSVQADAQGLEVWHTYHVVGDVLRSAELAPHSSGFDFLAKLEKRLATEAAPGSGERSPPLVAVSTVDMRQHQESANAPVFRWKLLAGVACTALVGVLVMGRWTQVEVGTNAQLAAVPAAAELSKPVRLGEADSQGMIRDPVLDSMLAAHRQLGGHSALQRPSGFLRNATYEGSQR